MAELLNSIMPFAGSYAPESYEYYGEASVEIQYGNDIRYIIKKQPNANGNENDAMIGQIMLFAGDFAPMDWRFCDGSLMDIWHNSALFAVLGGSYGGDWSNTFGLPKMPNVKNGGGGAELRYIICVEGIFPMRA